MHCVLSSNAVRGAYAGFGDVAASLLELCFLERGFFSLFALEIS